MEKAENRNKINDFYVNKSLYISQTVNYKSELFDIVFTKYSLDCYCIECKNKSIFNAIENLPPVKNNNLRGMFKVQNSNDWDIDLTNVNKIITKKFKCSRDGEHQIIFIIKVEQNKLFKIGQHPSYKDIKVINKSKYKKLLGDKYFKEYETALGLYSHGNGIGSFVYLRRIIENFIIKLAHDKAIKTSKWDESKYVNSKVKDKIKLLEDYLPDYLVENRNIYSIISKGIHELNEEECLNYFSSIERVLCIILDEIITKQDLEKSKNNLRNELSKINKDIR